MLGRSLIRPIFLLPVKHYQPVAVFANNAVSDMISRVTRTLRIFLALSLLILATLLASSTATQAQTAPTAADSILPGLKPSDVSADWKHLVGIYGKSRSNSLTIFERGGQLFLISPSPRVGNNLEIPLRELQNDQFSFSNESGVPMTVTSAPGHEAIVSYLLIGPAVTKESETPENTKGTYRMDGTLIFPRADAGADSGGFYRVKPAKPVDELRESALRLSPPKEAGPFRRIDVVELATLDPGIHLDIRYASANNFLSTPVYTQARAFMQRPAAEALLCVLHKLQPLGYELLIHDAYRPWYVTKIFWDATPPEGKIFVADPQKGSKHNRGCAVDLTLYDLATGKAVEMPGLYDEMSPRSFPNFPGGTSLQRWHRDLLRRAMESEGFTVNEDEWWHFDYKDWKQYGILNVPFEKIAGGSE